MRSDSIRAMPIAELLHVSAARTRTSLGV